jgi:pyrimidine operon attenuation protein/uracil phosphoribosyltransferase
MMCCTPAEPSAPRWMPCWISGGHPKFRLCVLIDRRFSRELPIQPDYTGKTIDTIISQKVKVCWKENEADDEILMNRKPLFGAY